MSRTLPTSFDLERFKHAHVAVVDDERIICETIQGFLRHWGIGATTFTDPRPFLEAAKNECFDLFLLDVYFPELTIFDIMPDLSLFCPGGKVIIMTGYADKDNAVQALKMGAFDFLEKPLEMTILAHSIHRALETVEKERDFKLLLENLKRSEAELREHKERLEEMNRQLLETNKAMSVLAQNISRERERIERQVALKLRTLVLPVIEKLQANSRVAEYVGELDLVLRQILDELTSGMSVDSRIVSMLTFTELRVASLVKGGFTTDEIARQLGVSTSTIKTHRKNIRRKLKISNSRTSLRQFLQDSARHRDINGLFRLE